jgi:uncharacterized protein
MKEIYLNHNRYVYLSPYNHLINCELKEQFLNEADERRVQFVDEDLSQAKIKKNVKKLKQITLEVTQDCNLRCRYCSFNGLYLYHRQRSQKTMSLEVALKALDYIRDTVKGRHKREFAIGFYGGEPLLHFPLVKKIVAYAEKLFAGWDLIFTLSTNGTIIDEEIVAFLAAHHFKLLISLDGPAEIHDKNRRFINGTGSHKTVMANLRKIKNINPEFFKTIFLLSVFSRELPYIKIYNFFMENDLVNTNPVRSNSVSELDGEYYLKLSLKRSDAFKIGDQILSLIKKKRELTPFDWQFIKKYSQIQDLLNINRVSSLGTSCHFDSKLFVDADGRFHICERVNHKFPIGDVYAGFDFDKMAQMAHEYASEIKKKCALCDYKALCERCFVHLGKNGYFTIEDKFCESQKRFITFKLEKLVELKEENLI